MRGIAKILPMRSMGRGTKRSLVEGSSDLVAHTAPSVRHPSTTSWSPSPHFVRGGFLALALMFASPVMADSLLPAAEYADKQLADPAKEAQATALMETLRCLVCQSQSIADSNAEMAGDMRALVRTRIAAGESPDAVRKWLIERYGNWVSYEPPLDKLTWPLYALPALLLAIGLWIVSGRLKRRRKG